MTPAELRNRNFVTVAEAAETFGVDDRTLRRGVEDGTIPSIKVGAKVLIPGPRLADMIAPASRDTASQEAPSALSPDSAIAAALEILRGASAALEMLLGTPIGIRASITAHSEASVRGIRTGQSGAQTNGGGDEVSPTPDIGAA